MALMMHDSDPNAAKKHALYTLKVEVKHYFFSSGGHLTPPTPCFRGLCARVSKSATGTGRVADMVDPHTSISVVYARTITTNLPGTGIIGLWLWLGVRR